MKTYKKHIRLTALLTLSVILSCVQDDEFNVAEVEIGPIELTGSAITMEAMKDALLQEIAATGNNLLTFDNDVYVAGYVISNDEQGNFFEEIIIQDAATNGSRGVKVLIDANPLFQSFDVGRKVYTRLNGLTLGFNSGQLTLGLRNGNRVGQIPEALMFNFVVRDTLVVTLEPVVRNISELNEDIINTFVRLNDVQFNRNEALGEDALTYAGEETDQFDGERILESCAESSTIVFSTSTFADFKSVKLAPGRGSIEGIFTYNFFGDEFNIVVNSLDGVMLDGTDRCDPIEVDCGVAPTTGDTILFSEFFETQEEGDPISGNGWTNYIEAGTETWEAYFDDGSNASLGISARMGSFMSGDDSSIGWLITPEINFETQKGETLNFRTSNSFADGSTLEVFISADWDGDESTITAATWNLLPSAVLVQDDDFFGDWISSGNVDLSCIEGTGHIAWKYIGSGEEDFDGTYELDEIEIRSN